MTSNAGHFFTATVAIADHRSGDEGKVPKAGCTGASPALEAKDGKVEAPWLGCPPGGLPTGNSGCPGPMGAPVRTGGAQLTTRSCARISCRVVTWQSAGVGGVMHRAARGGACSREGGMALTPGAAAALLPFGAAL